MADDTAEQPLVGRSTEIAALHRSILRAQGGEPSVVLLRGEAGIGKTALARSARDDARRLGYTVVGGRCSRRLRGPLLPLIDSVLEIARRRLEADTQLTTHVELLQRIAEADTEALKIAESNVEARVAQAMSSGLILESYAQPVLLFIDDIQWSDDLTIGFLGHLIARISDDLEWRSPNLMIVLTQREGDESEYPAEVFTIVRDPITSIIDLGGLDRRDTGILAERLAGGSLSGRVRDEIHRVTRGNPLFVTTIIGGREASELTDENAFSGHPILPKSIELDIENRLATIGERNTDLIETIACLEHHFTRDHLLGIGKFGEDEIDAQLDALCEADVLTHRRREFEFAHELFRDALQASIPPNRLERIHLSIFHSIRDREHEAERRSHHLEYAAPRLDPSELVHYAMESARLHANRGDWVSAARFAELAMGAANDAEAADRVEIATLAGIARSNTGDTEDASRYLLDALEAHVEIDPSTELRILATVINIAAREHSRIAPEHVDRARELVDDLYLVDPELACEADATIAQALWNVGQVERPASVGPLFAEAQEMADRAITRAREMGAHAAMGYATTTLVAANWWRMDLIGAADVNSATFETLDEAGADPHHRVGVLRTLALMKSWFGELDEAQRLVEHGLEVTRRHDLVWHEGFLLAVLAGVTAAQGHISEALEQVRRSVALDERRNPFSHAFSRPLYASLTALSGSRDEVAEALSGRNRLLGNAPLPRLVRCTTMALAGDTEGATREAVDVVETTDEMELHNVTCGPTLAELVRVSELVDDPRPAQAALEPLVRLEEAGMLYCPGALATTARLHAAALRATGQESWIEEMERALDQAIDLGVRVDVARAALALLEVPSLTERSSDELHERFESAVAQGTITALDGWSAPATTRDPGPKDRVAVETVVMFLDVFDSTRLTAELGDSAYLERQRQALGNARRAIVDQGGRVVLGLNAGDGLLATFPSAFSAARASAGVHRAAGEAGLQFRVGMHLGEVIAESGNVFGHNVNLTARVCDAAEPGKTVMTQAMAQRLRSTGDAALRDIGTVEMKGLDKPHELAELVKIGQD